MSIGIGPVCRGRKFLQGELFMDSEWKACFDVLKETPDFIYIKDIGQYRSVTNDAEYVIGKLSEENNLGNRRVFYIDSDGQIDELLHKADRFTGFKPGHEGVEL
jgi:hypothetical protein